MNKPIFNIFTLNGMIDYMTFRLDNGMDFLNPEYKNAEKINEIINKNANDLCLKLNESFKNEPIEETILETEKYCLKVPCRKFADCILELYSEFKLINKTN